MSPLVIPVRDYSQVWLVDSSRVAAAHHCRMKRYLGYHAGPYGTGLTRRSLSLPLIQGIHVHAALATILQEAKDQGGKAPSPEFVQLAVSVEVERYKALVRAKGLLGGDSRNGVDALQGSTTGTPNADSDVHTRVVEQTALLAGLVFGYSRITLPVLLEEFEILHVEQEQDIDVGNRVLLMTRPDALLRDRVTGHAVMLDFKTASNVSATYIEQWKNSVQMMAGARGASELLGEPVTRFYIHALVKGSLKPDYNEATGAYDGPKRQQSFLVWPYYRPGTPPMVPDEWQPFWKYACGDYQSCGKTRTGAPHNHTLGKGWERRLVEDPWKWVESLRDGEIASAFQILGPYEVNSYKVDQYLRGLEADEQEWISRVGQANTLEAGLTSPEQPGWSTQEFQEGLDRLFPRSYKCENDYGAPCAFKALCFKGDPGWVDPVGSGLYVHRAPHHAQEESSFRLQGIPLANEAGEFEESE